MIKHAFFNFRENENDEKGQKISFFADFKKMLFFVIFPVLVTFYEFRNSRKTSFFIILSFSEDFIKTTDTGPKRFLKSTPRYSPFHLWDGARS